MSNKFLYLLLALIVVGLLACGYIFLEILMDKPPINSSLVPTLYGETCADCGAYQYQYPREYQQGRYFLSNTPSLPKQDVEQSCEAIGND